MNKLIIKTRNWILGLVAVVSAMWLWSLDPVSQNLFYHEFADQRSFWGIPHFCDVMSNIPFLVVGIVGILYCFKNRHISNWWGWLTLFVGLAWVCFGSAYYHWEPTNQRLVWDRLPMTIGFMSLFVILLSEYVDRRLNKLLIPLLLLGVYSVYYWAQVDDLRIYIWVQAFPMLCIVLLVLLYQSRYKDKVLLSTSLGLYVLAKMSESWDTQIFEISSGFASGHTIKHLLAALGAVFLYKIMKLRGVK